jgi:hypothetical protein
MTAIFTSVSTIFSRVTIMDIGPSSTAWLPRPVRQKNVE